MSDAQLSNPGSKVTADAIKSGLEPGSDPMDFINKNLKARAKPMGNAPLVPDEVKPPSAPMHTEPSSQPKPSPKVSFANPQPQTSDEGVIPLTSNIPDKAFGVDLFTDEQLKEVKADPFKAIPPNAEDQLISQNTEIKIDPAIEPEQEIVQESTFDPRELTEEEYAQYSEKVRKRMKTITAAKREAEAVATEAQVKLQQATEELELYKTGTIVPDVIRNYEEKITELSKYEQLVALETSPEFIERRIKPLEQHKEKARELAAQCGVNAAVFDEALKLPAGSKRDTYLSQHFGNAVTALKASNILDDITNIAIGIEEDKKQPAQELERLRQQVIVDQGKNLEKLNALGKTSWHSALKEIQDTNQFPELQMRQGDEEHNKIVRPIIDGASQEYNRLIKELVDNGLKTLPPATAKALAKYISLGKASAVMSASRDSYAQHVKNIEKNIERNSHMDRPIIGGAQPGLSRTIQSKAPQSPEEAAKLLSAQFFK